MTTTYTNYRKGLITILALAVIAALLAAPLQTVQAFTIPTFEITSVVKDTSVTITTANFPAGQTFTVRIGAYGTLGVGGTVVGTTDSGAGGSFTKTYSIPAAFAGATRLAIRMDSPQGYFSYNWFLNNPTTTPTPGYTGIPTFAITSVDPGKTVTITTNNFPANKDFTVRIDTYGDLGVGGTVVATTASGTGGSFSKTYNIPAALKNEVRLAIRMDSTSGGFFAYNWFMNNAPVVTPTPGSTAIPTFSITAVVEDSTVTITTKNFPANKDFTVRMGAYGTLGVGGTVVATTNSGTGGSFSKTYDIPAGLKGSTRIAIRMDATSGGFFAYNWFWNN